MYCYYVFDIGLAFNWSLDRFYINYEIVCKSSLAIEFCQNAIVLCLSCCKLLISDVEEVYIMYDD